MLVRELFHRVSLLLKDVAPQFRHWTERELVLWANDGQRALAKYLPIVGGRVDSIRLQPGARQFIGTIDAADVLPGDGSTAADVRVIALQDMSANMGKDGLTPGASISIVSREMFDAMSRAWRREPGTGTVEHYAYDPQTPGVCWVYPPVSASIATWVEVSLLACPQEIPQPASAGDYGFDGAGTAVIGIPDQYADDLTNYIVARAWMKDGEMANAALAQQYSGLFVNSLNAQVTVLTGKNPNLKTMPLTPDVPAAAS